MHYGLAGLATPRPRLHTEKMLTQLDYLDPAGHLHLCLALKYIIIVINST